MITVALNQTFFLWFLWICFTVSGLAYIYSGWKKTEISIFLSGAIITCVCILALVI